MIAMITQQEDGTMVLPIAPGTRETFELIGSDPRLVLTAELLHVFRMTGRPWWRFVLMQERGPTPVLCELRVYDPALAYPSLVAVVKDVFPEPPSRHPEEISTRHFVCERLRNLFGQYP